MQAAEIRHAELSEFFSRLGQTPEEAIDPAELAAAVQAAAEVADYLQRAQMHVNQEKAAGYPADGPYQ
jgi:hypothetical protein